VSEWRVVYKYPMNAPVVDLDLPVGAKVVAVATQDNVPTLWIEHDQQPLTTQRRTFVGHGTGHPIPEGEVHVGSAHGVDGWMVFHIYERTGQ